MGALSALSLTVQISQTVFSSVVTTHNDETPHVKNFFRFFTPFGHGVPGWGPSEGLVYVCLAHTVFSLNSSQMEIPKTTFFRTAVHIA